MTTIRRAITFVAELEQRCQTLGAAPRAYPLLPGYGASGIRRWPYRNYLIFFRINDRANFIEVLHVLNGAQDYEAIMFPRS